ncbi:hypothetical protein [Ferrovibrio xuzhouensis]|uniref:Copper(I)-binding protein n=1 Tax=Ferrovibrio xuzhouensis TaxID=1576914 RepID=A0ABV7VBV2_9PROT
MMRRREWIAAALIGFAMTLSSNFTRADEVVDPGSLNIVDPIISKGSNGSYRLMFILENHTGMPITILGISSSYFSDATFEFRSDGEAVSSLDSITIQSNDFLNLASSHQWFRLDGFKADLSKSGLIPFVVRFTHGRMQQGHAHLQK